MMLCFPEHTGYGFRSPLCRGRRLLPPQGLSRHGSATVAGQRCVRLWPALQTRLVTQPTPGKAELIRLCSLTKYEAVCLRWGLLHIKYSPHLLLDGGVWMLPWLDSAYYSYQIKNGLGGCYCLMVWHTSSCTVTSGSHWSAAAAFYLFLKKLV